MTIESSVAAILWQGPHTPSRKYQIKCQTWALNYINMKNIFNSTRLPGVTGVDVIIESFKEDEKLVGRSVLLVKKYEILDSVSI